MRTFLDTLFVIALINPRDQHHARAVELSVRYDGQPLLTTDAVLFEIGNGLAKRFRAEAAEVIAHLRSSAEVTVAPTTPELLTAALDLYASRPDQEWGLTDCLSFVVMQQEGVTDALTFDHHFTQAGFVPLMR